MKFDRLRITGFKTFVDPTEMVIEPGLTGVVGPNGCGKSNLVEALRWVMGETSHKSMRASGMDDVIFSGGGQRPARNHAEVMLRIDNGAHDAPAAFNEADHLEISRRIERESGSTYKVNGREVRARDVQLLFADAASGARSPSMVRQGQISEIISAKPQARRRVLEDAAGVAGLHARRHDAELKLRAAEENLTRVVDVLRHIDGQIDGLKRQARQAERYRSVAAEIRISEAVVLQTSWFAAKSAVVAATRQIDADTVAVAQALTVQGESERERAVAQHAIEPLRLAEAVSSEQLQRLLIAREALDGEERRAKGRQEELDRRLDELSRDSERAKRLGQDAETALQRLVDEREALGVGASDGEAETSAAARLAQAEAGVTTAERLLEGIQTELAEAVAFRAAAERALGEATARLTRIEGQFAESQRNRTRLIEASAAAPDLAALRNGLETASRALERAEAAGIASEKRHREVREHELRLRPQLQEADRATQRLETEARTIRKLFDTGANDLWPRAVDAITVAKGYENALGAAFGDELEASTAASAPAHWAGSLSDPADPALPTGARCLAEFVEAPLALSRRLALVGVVTRADGARLRSLLKPGQRLVSREGDLWRWDGFTSAADAPSAAARRLAEKNRLGEIEADAQEAIRKRDSIRADIDAVASELRTVAQAEATAREGIRDARRTLDARRDSLSVAEKRSAEHASRLASLNDALMRFESEIDNAELGCREAAAALAGASGPGDLAQRVAEQRAKAAEQRFQAAEARAALQGLVRERELLTRRLAAIGDDIRAWEGRKAQAANQIAEIDERFAAVRTERAGIDGLPAELMARRRSLGGDIEAAETRRKAAADDRAIGETALAAFDRAARDAMAALSTRRENRARSEVLLESASARLETLATEIADAMDLAPDALSGITGFLSAESLPPSAISDARLQELKRERERIGPVNLRADTELSEIETTKTDLAREHGELTEAIRRLRRGIESLNAEGRNRLLAAFEVVNGHFRTLFSRLFGGGTAELQLIESDDPLEAGLEILANPPGKKPQVLTLLSGGEQALTATALIFAVFLTNPSPVCVLDEVDAPLDDANVDRLCDLLADMARETETRFVVITHNPITMARMDRLFGVTMAERGISQLVSVDLQAAERLVEAV